MTLSCPGCESGVAFALVIAAALSASLVHLEGSAGDLAGVPARAQASDSREASAARPGVCEREAEKLVGQKAVRIEGAGRAPKKLRDVPPKYPQLPAGTFLSGVWGGELLIDGTGKVAHVWTIREVKLVPPLPAFNAAIVDAMQQWEFEPLLVMGKPAAFCMTVAVTIDWA